VPEGQRRAVFRDAELDEAFRRDGYVTVPLLEPDEVDALRARLESMNAEQRDGFTADTELEDPTYKAAAYATILAAHGDRLERLLVDYEPFLANYITKQPGEGSELSLHQDWNFVDEAKYQCAFVWVPMVDVSRALDNGPVYMIPGCHLLDTLRGGGRLVPMWPGLGAKLEDAGLPSTDVRAGEAIVWDPALPHYSGPNRSDAGRPVTLIALAPREAELSYCYAGEEGPVLHAPVEQSTFIHHSMPTLAQGVPDDLPHEVLQDDRGPLTAQQIVDRCLELEIVDATHFHDPGPAAESATPAQAVAAPPRPLWRRAAGKVRRTLSR